MASIKKLVRQLLWSLHLDITQNLRYDRATQKIIRQILKKDSHCVDVGAHKGEILQLIYQCAPDGQHLAIEPIPHLAEGLRQKFGHTTCRIIQAALSNYQGSTTFNLVRNAEAYSGLRKREYAVAEPAIESIPVQVYCLDELWDFSLRPTLLKLDIEGGEFDALQGASKLIRQFRPYVIFEFGLGSAEFYDSKPADMFDFFTENRMGLAVLDQWYPDSPSLEKSDFIRHFQEKTAYYFIAFPQSS